MADGLRDVERRRTGLHAGVSTVGGSDVNHI